jgi:hypothetical protein
MVGTFFIALFAVIFLTVVGATLLKLTGQLEEKQNSPTAAQPSKPKPRSAEIMPTDLKRGIAKRITELQEPGPQEDTSNTKGEHSFVQLDNFTWEAQGDVRDEDFKELAKKNSWTLGYRIRE